MTPLQIVPCTYAYPGRCHCVNKTFDPSIGIFNNLFDLLNCWNSIVSIFLAFGKSSGYFLPRDWYVCHFTKQLDALHIVSDCSTSYFLLVHPVFLILNKFQQVCKCPIEITLALFGEHPCFIF